MTEPICPIDDSDTDVRYLAGQLSAPDAEAFEEHYFDCDICWNAVQRGTEIRSALAHPVSRGSQRRQNWWPLLAAAAVLVVVAGIWQVQRPVGEASLSADPHVEPMRGNPTLSAISVTARDKALAASWSHAPDASTYSVRLMASDGQLLFERETSDTSITVPTDSLARPERGGSIYWQVEALNDLRVVVRSYPLTEARPSR